MKKAILVFCVAGFLFACKKDKSSNTSETVLSKIYTNNKLTYEFIYSPQKQITTVNEYDEISGKLSFSNVFIYNANGQIVENKHYSNNKLTGKVVYTIESDGKINQHQYMSLSGADSGKFTNRVKYSYDGAGRISQQAWLDLTTGVPETSRDLVYYDNNNLRSSSNWNYYGAPELQWKTEYAAGDPLPASIYKHRGYPVNFILYDMVSPESHFLQYNNGAVSMEQKEIFTNRKYDSEGYLLEQTSTLKKILPAAPSIVKQLKYEYIKL